MEIKGCNGNEISEQDKMALQLKTKKEVGQIMRTEVKHFTTEMTTDSAYGWTWNEVVKEYLKTGYKVEGTQMDVVVLGVTYRILKRPEVTVFYDASGNTLFDVTNERLEKEYEWLMNGGDGADMEHGDSGEVPGTEQTDDEEDDVPPDRTDNNMIPMGKASLKEIATGLPAPTVEEIEAAREENAKPVKQRAKEKLEKELEVTKDSMFADPIIGYLLKRCEEDEGLAQDVIQEHKTWNKCVDYIFSQARKQSMGNCAAVRDDVVYEWAEDYYHLDDKAAEEKKAKEAAERKKKAAEWKEKAKSGKKDHAKKPAPAANNQPVNAPIPVTETKPQHKPKKNEMDGQMDLFSMMGM